MRKWNFFRFLALMATLAFFAAVPFVTGAGPPGDNPSVTGVHSAITPDNAPELRALPSGTTDSPTPATMSEALTIVPTTSWAVPLPAQANVADCNENVNTVLITKEAPRAGTTGKSLAVADSGSHAPLTLIPAESGGGTHKKEYPFKERPFVLANKFSRFVTQRT